MTEAFELKSISAAAIPEALEKAEHYRLLNDPGPAESICLDILAIDPGNQKALVALVLAITDQFAPGGATASAQRAREYVDRLSGEYERLYYAGIVCERQARAYLGRGMARGFAYDAFRDAMDHYEKAEAARPTGNDDALLRWNSCVRTIQREKLKPRPDEGELQLE